jgi:TolA-binding protein
VIIQSCRRPALVLALLLSLCGTSARALSFSGPDDDQSYRTGIGLLNKGLSDLAATEFRKYLDEHPDGKESTNARYSLAVCLTRLEKHAQASQELSAVLNVKGFDFAPDATLLQAQCLVATGDDAAAAELLDAMPSRYPSFAQLDRCEAIRGESLYRTGAYKPAKDALAGVAAKWPKSPAADRAELFAAMAEVASGDSKAAADRAARLRAKAPTGEYATNAALIEAQCRVRLKDTEGALPLFEIASKGAEPVRSEALLGLAGAARARGDASRAEKALAEADTPKTADALRPWLTLERGKLLFDKGDLPAALAAFSTAQKSADDALKPEAAYWFARAQARQGKHEEAAANLENAAERFPKSTLVPDMLYERAAALSKAGDDQAAFEAWSLWRERFIASDLAPGALLAQAWCAHRLGKLDACAQLCDALSKTQAAPTSSESFGLLRAENLYAMRSLEPAAAAYTDFARRFPKSEHAWRAGVRRVLCLVELGKVDEAAGALDPLLASADKQDRSLTRAALTALADAYFSKSDWPKSEPWFARLAAQSTGDDQSDALLRQAICLERQRRFEPAIALFDQVIQSDAGSPRTLQARFERGQSLMELGRLDEAKAAFEQVINAKDSAALAMHARRHLASIASKQGRPEEAATLLADLPPDATDASSRLALGSAYLAAGKYELAEKALGDFLRSSGDSKDAPKARVLRAIAIGRQGHFDEAIEQLKAIPGAGLDAETKANGDYELAAALRGLGRESEAAEALRQVTASSSPRLKTYALLELSQAETKAGRHEQALKLLDDALAASSSLDKSDGALIRERATYLRAACLVQLARPKDAAEALKAFAETYPQSPLLGAVHLVRGDALLAAGDARAAAAELALAAEDTSEQTQQSALLRLGNAWATAQDWPKSEQAFTTFLDRFSDSPLWFQARFGQGWARENQGRHEPAMEAYRDVVARHKGATAARAQFQIGECLYAQKKLEPAVAELLKTDVLFAYAEWSAAALYEAGRCLDEMGRPDDAAKQFDDLMKRFPDSRWASLASEKRRASAPASLPGRDDAAPPGR